MLHVAYCTQNKRRMSLAVELAPLKRLWMRTYKVFRCQSMELTAEFVQMFMAQSETLGDRHKSIKFQDLIHHDSSSWSLCIGNAELCLLHVKIWQRHYQRGQRGLKAYLKLVLQIFLLIKLCFAVGWIDVRPYAIRAGNAIRQTNEKRT